jgi:hypothetical protein
MEKPSIRKRNSASKLQQAGLRYQTIRKVVERFAV